MHRLLAITLVAAAASACSLKFEARLLDPFNRPVSVSAEDALVARARRLLQAGLSPADVAQNLVAQGQSQTEADRIVALAQGGK